MSESAWWSATRVPWAEKLRILHTKSQILRSPKRVEQVSKFQPPNPAQPKGSRATSDPIQIPIDAPKYPGRSNGAKDARQIDSWPSPGPDSNSQSAARTPLASSHCFREMFRGPSLDSMRADQASPTPDVGVGSFQGGEKTTSLLRGRCEDDCAQSLDDRVVDFRKYGESTSSVFHKVGAPR